MHEFQLVDQVNGNPAAAAQRLVDCDFEGCADTDIEQWQHLTGDLAVHTIDATHIHKWREAWRQIAPAFSPGFRDVVEGILREPDGRP